MSKPVRPMPSHLDQVEHARIVQFHPGDWFFTRAGKNAGLMRREGIFLIFGPSQLNNAFSEGLFIDLDAPINPDIEPVHLIGIRFQVISELTFDQQLFWSKIIRERYEPF